jgi:hypothetical protein
VKGAIVAVLPEARNRGAISRHVAIANELTAHWAFESFIPCEEAGVVNAPQKFHFLSELSGYEGGVSAMVGEICAISFGCGEEVAMFGGVVEGSDGGG